MTVSSTPTEPDGRDPLGWGLRSESLTREERDGLAEMLTGQFGADAVWRCPPPAHELAGSRIRVPDGLAAAVTTGDEARLAHAVGRSFTDLVALRETGVTRGPDAVARPRDADEVERILAWCVDEGHACVPFGGGTSVVGGVTAGGLERPVVVLQTRAMDDVTDVDPRSRAARIEAGATGPVLEAQLRQHDMTLRFFPQSFEMSTLGGWVATRAGGHYATKLTHIDDLVESVEAVTPAGRWTSRRLPGSGAGPSPDRLLLGSEGTLGVITAAWVRTQSPPAHKGGLTATFPDLATALAALAPLVQSGLDPANCRVLDPTEALLNGAGDGSAAVLLAGAESPAAPVDADLAVMAAILADHGGQVSPPSTRSSGAGEGAEARGAAADAWRRSFLRAPYLRDGLIDAGMVVETFETAMTHDRLPGFVADVLTATREAVRAVCDGGVVTCRVTHAYPDGAAPYFTVIAPGRRGARAAQWGEIKAAASEALMAAGGTITHHHAVGRDHRPWYDRQRPDPFAAALTAAKGAVDPAGVLNPGVLLDPPPPRRRG